MSREQEIRERVEKQKGTRYGASPDVLWLLAELEREREGAAVLREDAAVWQEIAEMRLVAIQAARELCSRASGVCFPDYEALAAAGGETG